MAEPSPEKLQYKVCAFLQGGLTIQNLAKLYTDL